MFLDQPSWTVDRKTAIGLFGATYIHGGSWKEPIVEVLGQRTADPDPVKGRNLFDNEDKAVAHVRQLARDHAEAAEAQADAFYSDRKTRLALWWATRIYSARRKATGLLATEAVIAQARREGRQILKNGVVPRIVRIPEILRLPQVLGIGTPVVVVDARNFPTGPIRLLSDRILERSVVEVSAHPAFDVVVRYRLETLPGLLGYDVAAGDDGELTGAPEGTAVFLRKDIAAAKLRRTGQRLAEMIDQSLQGLDVLDLPTVEGTLFEIGSATETPTASENDAPATPRMDGDAAAATITAADLQPCVADAPIDSHATMGSQVDLVEVEAPLAAGEPMAVPETTRTPGGFWSRLSSLFRGKTAPSRPAEPAMDGDDQPQPRRTGSELERFLAKGARVVTPAGRTSLLAETHAATPERTTA